MKLKFLDSPYPDIPAGTEVEVDKIRFYSRSASGISVRVINLKKKPEWWDLGYFLEIPPEMLEAALKMKVASDSIPF